MPKKLLLVEGDATFARSLAAALGARGLEVRVTLDGDEGIGLARAERPDAIVLAAELPRSSGFAVCNRIKKDPDLGAIPVVLTSSKAGEETFEQHRKLKTRADDYAAKPFRPDELLARLAPLLGLPAARAEPEAVTLEVEGVDATVAALEAAAAAGPPVDDAGLAELDAAFASIAGDAAPALPQPAAPAPPPAADERRDDGRAALEAELARARQELDEARRTIAELEARSAKHEQLVVKAYQRLTSDATSREKARKAIAIALQLLEGGAPEAPPAGPQGRAGDAPPGESTSTPK